MTMTPIEEAAERAVTALLGKRNVELSADEHREVSKLVAYVFKRVLSERVTARPGAGYTNPNAANRAEGWNDCREYIGLED